MVRRTTRAIMGGRPCSKAASGHRTCTAVHPRKLCIDMCIDMCIETTALRTNIGYVRILKYGTCLLEAVVAFLDQLLVM